MLDAISNTSPLLYLHRIGVLDWLPRLFGEVSIPSAVADELDEGRKRGHDAPDARNYGWLRIVDPAATPSEWLALDLGPGELSAMALALEDPNSVLLLDDLLARRTAKAAGLTVWGTLRILLEAKTHHLTDEVAPFVTSLGKSGMWISEEVRQRILALADERPAS